MKNRPSWEEFFMFIAISCATRHSCLKRGVGAVIVKDNRIIGTGYNGAASGIRSCRDMENCYYDFLAKREIEKNGGSKETTRESFKIYCQAVHAEANAISQCLGGEAKGASLFVTNFPCPKCAQDVVITNKILSVYVWKDYLENPALTIDEQRASKTKLLEAGVSVRFIDLTKKRIMEIAKYMASNVGERTNYKFKGGE